MTTIELTKGVELEMFCTEYLEHTGHDDDFLPGRLLWRALNNAAGQPYGSKHLWGRTQTNVSRFVAERYGLKPRHYSLYTHEGDPTGLEDVLNKVVAGWKGIRLTSAGYALLRAEG